MVVHLADDDIGGAGGFGDRSIGDDEGVGSDLNPLGVVGGEIERLFASGERHAKAP